MALQIKSLKQIAMPETAEDDIYVVPVNKTAIVKSLRLVNTEASAVTVNLFVRRGTDDPYRIAPVNLSIPAGAALIDDSEITLEGKATLAASDRITGYVTSGTVDCVISGVERE